jgi:hypothetical protein
VDVDDVQGLALWSNGALTSSDSTVCAPHMGLTPCSTIIGKISRVDRARADLRGAIAAGDQGIAQSRAKYNILHVPGELLSP